MGIFRTTMRIENSANRGPTCELPDTLVDTGSEYSWAPRVELERLGIRAERKQRFRLADGRAIERDLGFAIVHAGGIDAPDLVVFAEQGDMVLLGARSLEGLNLMIDQVRKQFVSAGPIIAASAA